MVDTAIQLIRPNQTYLQSYVEALEKGYSPSSTRPRQRLDELEAIKQNPVEFLATIDDAEAKGPPLTLPDGTSVPRLPRHERWMWDGDFAGSIGLRWQPGTPDLPPHCLGHIGYSVVPWKRQKGYATIALRLMLPEAAALGLPYVEVVTDTDNTASQRVILANGGALVERFHKGPNLGGGAALRFRIDLR